jgi:hypothetical protein
MTEQTPTLQIAKRQHLIRASCNPQLTVSLQKPINFTGEWLAPRLR